jgi:hypothetical protein
MSIEGIHRKLTLFKNPDLSQLCDFWGGLRKGLLKGISDFSHDQLGISYEKLVEHSRT